MRVRRACAYWRWAMSSVDVLIPPAWNCCGVISSESRGGAFGIAPRAAQVARIRLKRAQRVGDILQCRQYRAAVLRRGLVEIVEGRAALGAQFTAVKQRLHERAADVPGRGAGPEQIAGECVSEPMLPVQLQLRVQVRGGNPRLRTGLMQLRLRGQHIRALAHEFRGHAQRQLVGNVRSSSRSPERRSIRRSTGQHRQPMLRLGKVLLECGQHRLGLSHLCVLD